MTEIKIFSSCRLIIYTYHKMNFNYRVLSNLSKKDRELVQNVKNQVKDCKNHGYLYIKLQETPNSLDNLIYLQTFSYKFIISRVYGEKDLVGIYYDYFIQSLPKYIGERITLNINRNWTAYDSLRQSITDWETKHNIKIKKDVYKLGNQYITSPLSKFQICKNTQYFEIYHCLLNNEAKELIRSYQVYVFSGLILQQNQIQYILTFPIEDCESYNFKKVTFKSCIMIDPRDVQMFKNTQILKLRNVPSHKLVRDEIQKLKNLVKFYHITTKNVEFTAFNLQEQSVLQVLDLQMPEVLLKFQNVQSFFFTISSDLDSQNLINSLRQVNRKISKLKVLIRTQIDMNWILNLCKISQYVGKYVIITIDLKLDLSQNTAGNGSQESDFDLLGITPQQNIEKIIGQNYSNTQILQNVRNKRKTQKIKLNILTNWINEEGNIDIFENQSIDIRFQDFFDLKSKIYINYG